MLLRQAEQRARCAFEAYFATDLLFHKTILPLGANAHNQHNRMLVMVDTTVHRGVVRTTSQVEFGQVWQDEMYV